MSTSQHRRPLNILTCGDSRTPHSSTTMHSRLVCRLAKCHIAYTSVITDKNTYPRKTRKSLLNIRFIYIFPNIHSPLTLGYKKYQNYSFSPILLQFTTIHHQQISQNAKIWKNLLKNSEILHKCCLWCLWHFASLQWFAKTKMYVLAVQPICPVRQNRHNFWTNLSEFLMY